MNLTEIADKLAATLEAEWLPAGADFLDIQALCVAEEAGEVVGAYRRFAGKARRKGTLEDVRSEIADVLITVSIFARLLGIDIDSAVEDKLAVIYSRGWSESA